MNKSKFTLFLLLTTVVSLEKLQAMDDLDSKRSAPLKQNNELYCNESALNLYDKAKQYMHKKKHNEESLSQLIYAHNAGHPYAFREFCENYSIWKINPKFNEFNIEQEYYIKSQIIKGENTNVHNKESLKYLQYAALLGNEYADCEFLEEFKIWKDDPDFSNKKHEKKIKKENQYYSPGYFWLKKSSLYHVYRNRIKEYEFLLKSAEKEHPVACYEYGRYLISQEDKLEEGINFIKISASKEYDEAIKFLNEQGLHFFTEYNRFKSLAKDPEKTSNMSNLYKRKAMKYLKISANLEYGEGCYEYGRYLIDQKNILEKGREYISTAIKKGNEEAQLYMEENPHVYSFHPYVRKLATISSHHSQIDQIKNIINVCGFILPIFIKNTQLIDNIGIATKGISGLANTIFGISNFLLRGHQKYILMTASGLTTITNTAFLCYENYRTKTIDEDAKSKLAEIKQMHTKIENANSEISSLDQKCSQNMHHNKDLMREGFIVLDHLEAGHITTAVQKGIQLANSDLKTILEQQVQLADQLISERKELIKFNNENRTELYKKIDNFKIVREDKNQLFFYKVILNFLESGFNRYVMMTDKNTQDHYKDIEVKYGKYARYSIQYILAFISTFIEVGKPYIDDYQTYDENDLKCITNENMEYVEMYTTE